MDSASSIIRFSLDEVPERERLAALTEAFGRAVANTDFVPLSERPKFEFEIRLFPGLAITQGINSPHLCTAGYDRSRENDDLVLVWGRRLAKASMIHRGKQTWGNDGTASFLSCTEPAIAETHSEFHFSNIRVARKLLTTRLRHPEDRLMQAVPPSNEALQLLNRYLHLIFSEAEPESPELAQAVSLHVADLVALAVGTSGDGLHHAVNGGLRAARLVSVKSWALERIGDLSLSVSAVAAAHRISPRYVQMLFEQEGTTFSDWLRGERLALARRRLVDPAFVHHGIAMIAFDCGFSDLSWFNRAFRHSYGETPSDVRHAAQSGTRH